MLDCPLYSDIRETQFRKLIAKDQSSVVLLILVCYLIIIIIVKIVSASKWVYIMPPNFDGVYAHRFFMGLT